MRFRPDVTISPALRGEHARIVEIWEASVRATHHFLAEADIHFFEPLVACALSSVELRCARDEAGEIVGFAGVAGGKLEMLFVDPALRRSGIGGKLLDHCVHRLRVTSVDVNEQNPAAVAFYERMGFVVEGRSELDGSGRPFPLLHMRRG